jgi:hypothetical protein
VLRETSMTAHPLREAIHRAHASPRWRAAAIVLAGLSIAALAYGGVATSGGATCPSRLVLDAPCASCGMTRAFAALTHGDLAYATRANLGAPFAFAIVIAHGLAYLAQWISGRTYVRDFWANPTRKRVAGGLILALLLISWVTNVQRHRRGEGPLRLAPWHQTHGARPWVDLPGGS